VSGVLLQGAGAGGTGLCYRLYEDRDLPALLRLWNADSSWGTLSAERWAQWYRDTPHGSGLIVVAEDGGGDIVGQVVMTPALALVAGAPVRALRVSAPIVRSDVRFGSARSRQHPAFNLYFAGMRAGRSAGYQLVYAYPEPAWLPLLRWAQQAVPHTPTAAHWAPRVVSDHCCVARPLSALPADGDTHVTADPLPGSDYDRLWELAVAGLPVQSGIVRSSGWLRYKRGKRLLLEVRRADGQLLGYCLIDRKTGLLYDTLAANPEDLVRVLRAALVWLAAHSVEFPALKAMASGLLAPLLQELGFVPEPYRFVWFADWLVPGRALSALEAEGWFRTPGD
jgi:hypothetical protein